MAERWDAQFTVLSRDEEKLYRVKHLWPQVRVIKGSIEDERLLDSVMAGHDVVIHAAAVKYVPDAEFASVDAFKVNDLGTYNVATAAFRHDVRRAVFISTDKACMPVNLYGATKMIGEKIWSEANSWGQTLFVTARYGNVVGSTGSIAPIFARQLAETGRVSVTDPTMTRFWMSPLEAIRCITDALQLAHIAPGGIFAARCPAMSIGELAQLIVNLDRPDVEDGLLIDVTGPRPGEKHDEVLVHQYEWPRMFEYENGFVILPSTTKKSPAEIKRMGPFEPGEGGLPGPDYSSDRAPHVGTVRMAQLLKEARSI